MLLIWIKHRIELSTKIKSAILKFDNFHEQNFELMYQDVKNQINKKTSIDLEQFVVYCSHYLVEFLRLLDNSKQERLAEVAGDISLYCRGFDDIKQVNFELIIDRLPKRIFTLSPSKTVLAEQIR